MEILKWFQRTINILITIPPCFLQKIGGLPDLHRVGITPRNWKSDVTVAKSFPALLGKFIAFLVKILASVNNS